MSNIDGFRVATMPVYLILWLDIKIVNNVFYAFFRFFSITNNLIDNKENSWGLNQNPLKHHQIWNLIYQAFHDKKRKRKLGEESQTRLETKDETLEANKSEQW